MRSNVRIVSRQIHAIRQMLLRWNNPKHFWTNGNSILVLFQSWAIWRTKKKWMNRLLSVNEHKLINRTLKPSSGFSLVIRAAITCPHGVGGLGGLSKSMGMLSQGLRRYKVRIDLIRYKGIPIAICSWAAGKFTSDTISVQGCSTCHLERELN